MDGAVGLDPAAAYYVYDFWADTLVGKLPGTATLEQVLGPKHCAMLSVRKAQAVPQVLSTSRHLLQGWVDLAEVQWDGPSQRLGGVAQVIGGEPFKIVLAGNGRRAVRVAAEGARAKLEPHPAGPELGVVVLERPDNGPVAWRAEFE